MGLGWGGIGRGGIEWEAVGWDGVGCDGIGVGWDWAGCYGINAAGCLTQAVARTLEGNAHWWACVGDGSPHAG